MDLDRELIQEGMKIRFKRVSGPDPYLEWLKWLSYVPEFEKNKLEELKSKKSEDLEIDELEFLLKDKKNKKMVKLFEKINKEQGTVEEELVVYDYTKKHKINKLMLSKLTKQELKEAKEKITEYTTKLSNDELSDKVDSESKDEIYKDLSMVDSYILNALASVDYARAIRELDEKISEACKQNDYMLMKSMEYASKLY